MEWVRQCIGLFTAAAVLPDHAPEARLDQL
jgi:hypothetical protein